MDMTHERKCPPTAETGRCADCIDASTPICRNVDRDPTRGRRLIAANVLGVTREHWLGSRSARIDQALAPILG